MRVAMVGPFGLKPKGTMVVRALPLAKALARRGHALRLVLPPWSYPQEARRAWGDDGVEIVNISVTPRGAIPSRLVSAARVWRPDVVHVFKPKGFSGAAQWILWQLRAAGLERARIVLDEDDWEGRGGWNELEPYSPLQKWVFERQELWGLTHADAVTVASRTLETIVWSLGVPRARVSYLPNGINPLPLGSASRAEVRQTLGLGDAPTILLYTRFFEFQPDRLGVILSRVLRVQPAARLLIVGKGLKDQDERFLQMADAQGWRSNVVYAGWIEWEQLGSYLHAADVAIYPFDDTLVNRTKAIVKLMDLLAAGIPVVAEAVGQIREYITPNDTGVLVAPGDADGFARSVLELLDDADKRERLGGCAARTMAREYDWDKLAEGVEALYAGQAKSLSSSSSVGT